MTETSPILTWANNPLQREFVFNPYRKSAFVGGIRAGKTWGCDARVLWLCDEMPGSRFLVGRRRFTDLYNTTLKDLLGLVAQRNGGAYDRPGPYVEKYDGQFHDLYLRNGSRLYFRHLDEVGNILGLEISGYFVDQMEELELELYYHIESRLSYWNVQRIAEFQAKNGGKTPRHFGFFSANPDPGWIRTLLFESKESAEWKVYQVSTAQNKANLGPDYIESLYRTHPKDWVERFIEGSWDIRGGQIYKEYNEAVHVIDPIPLPIHWKRYMVMDWGINEYHRCVTLWFAVSERGDIYVYRELSVTGLLVSQVAARQKELSAHDPMERIQDNGGIVAYFDPSTNNRNGVSERTVMTEFMVHGIYGRPANNDVDAGINKVKEVLHWDEKRGIKPKLHVFKDCQWTRRGFKLYQWQPVKIDGTGADKPLKKDDDEMDCLRYGIMQILEDRSPEMNTRTASADERRRAHDYSQWVMDNNLKPGSTAPPTVDYNTPLEDNFRTPSGGYSSDF